MGILKFFLGNKTTDRAVDIKRASPDFSLPDENGATVSLSDFHGKRNVLVFIIRGDFCPFCQMMLRAYQGERQKFLEKNVMIISIGPGPVEANYTMVKNMGLEYKVLCDEGQKVIGQFGSLDTKDTRMYPEGMPVPATFLIDKDGIIRFLSRADKAEEVFNPSAIFNALDRLN